MRNLIIGLVLSIFSLSTMANNECNTDVEVISACKEAVAYSALWPGEGPNQIVENTASVILEDEFYKKIRTDISVFKCYFKVDKVTKAGPNPGSTITVMGAISVQRLDCSAWRDFAAIGN